MAAIGCCLSRHNGIYVIIGTLIICLFVHKHRFKKIILMLFCILIVYRGFNTLLLSAYGITGTSVSEMMSIPFQQTARYVKEYSGEVTGEEEKIISQVLNFEELSENYNPISSDPVKGTYKSDATKQDIIEYLKIWTMMFFKHPKVYMEATLNNIYGYFFSGSCAVETYTIEYSMSNISHLNESGFDFYTPQGFIFFGRILDIWCNFFYTIPLIGVLGKSYIYTWIVLFFIIRLIWSKRWYKLEIYVPAFILILVCIAGPVNGSIYFRYMYPVAIIMPLLVGRDLFADK